MNCISGRVSEFLETAAFGCPAAGAADWPRAPEIQCWDDGLRSTRGTAFLLVVRPQTSRPSGDEQPKAAVPTQKSRHIAAWTTEAL
jgi:hypothetical protein